MQQLSKSAETIRARIEAGGPATTEELASATGFSKNTIRTSLRQLLAGGLLEQTSARQTGNRGRPAFVFQVPTPKQAEA